MSPAAPTLRDLFASEYGYVCHSLRRMGVPSRDLEDVAHDVFVAVHRHLPSYDPARPVKPWLFAFVFNAASVYRRRAHVRRERIETPPEGSSLGGESPEADALAQERRALLMDALQSVDADRRAVLVLHDIDETPMPQIAEALGIPLNTGYSRLRLARRELADALRSLKARRGMP